MSQLPASAARALRAQSAKSPAARAASAPGPVVVPPPAPAPAEPPTPQKTLDLDVIGPRKLIRPTLPESMLRDRRSWRHDEPALVSHAAAVHPAPAHHDASHAESFYFQKQVQSQTPMVFVLEDGEKIEGCIEWYDRNAIKVRSSGASLRSGRSEPPTRVLIYKSSIKYLYKSGENSPQP